ncbi:negative acting factor [Fusarium tjaetaba]|uniref:Negative acting factor n=1 Tax=Fusarium tjaetaba TaxID=1567544 RepID=A0A8H5RYR3_9HYPO|nr:negative acting factor [Fusarium tjaetaba]KAF5643361.1 negative acting factor [Fusarium tjaetaba]
MVTSRACLPCRTAKTKCDLKRPTCSFCSRRKIACGGYASDADYMSRNQNVTAKVNSERARRRSKHATNGLLLYGTDTHHDLRVLSIDARQGCEPRPSLAKPWNLADQKAWLSIPSPVLYRLEDRILDVFYAEWVSRPSTDFKHPGYLDLLPEMKVKAAPASALNLAVEAFALANGGNLMSCDGNLKQMAFSRYGAALESVRKAMVHHSIFADDATLMGIMAIDMFEVVFMVREEPLRLRNDAIEYLLAVRGVEQIQSDVGLALYRMANHRLQVRQLGFGLEPLPVQLACIDMLDLSVPRYSLCKMQLEAQQTLAMTRDLSFFHWEDLSLLIIRIQVQLEEYEQWKACLPESWVPKRIQIAEHRDVLQALIARSIPLTDHVCVYKESFIAHQMSFFYHGELALRSALIDALFAMKNMFLRQPDFEHEIETQQTAISRISDILVESINPLLASIHFDDCGSLCLAQERITVCYTRGICWALQQEKRVAAEHKSFTYRIENWIRQQIGLACQ